MQLTRYITVWHGTITYPDGSTESIEYINGQRTGSSLIFTDTDDLSEGWNVRYNSYTDRIEATRSTKNDSETTYSLHNLKKFETNTRSDEYVAVIEVPDEYVDETSRWFFTDRTTLDLPEDFEPDVTVWMKGEWEANNA